MNHSGNGKQAARKDHPDAGPYIVLISLHGLVRGSNWELGRDADTGGQIRYVVELARALGEDPNVGKVELITRQVIDSRVDASYAQLEENLSDKVSIRRIPFGPRRYLYKEKLWPYLDFFVDHMVTYFRRIGRVPDVIHGHYADAGQAGAQLARLLGVPFIFTGHSLGRVKRERLAHENKDLAELEHKYEFSTRIEAEEFALETASLVVASTFQEVEDQYQHYDHYVPERMEVIPPGVDLSAFHHRSDNDNQQGDVREGIRRFLIEPDKPMILAMARPDERKNLESLVHIFGRSEELQQRANLVLILGTRDDIRQMPPPQRRVMANILTLVDTYDLYGKVAYPKNHAPQEVPEIYRIAAETRGVFINAAYTEPFGLTLLEAAASGLPLVATNDGGPRDILANCKNGLLVDPFNHDQITLALLSVLDDDNRWNEWARNGLKGVRAHYSWSRHVERYLREVQELMSEKRPRQVIFPSKNRRLPKFDRLIVADIDNTLTGDDEALAELVEFLREHEDTVGLGIATGRSFEDATNLLRELPLPRPDILISSAGTDIHYGGNLEPDRAWQRHIRYHWKPDEVRRVLSELPGLNLQPTEHQSPTKVSYQLDTDFSPPLAEIRKYLRSAGLRTKVILSLGMFLDVIPARAGSGICIRHLSFKLGFPPERVLVAGDSGNDEEMLRGTTLGVVVGNASEELLKLRGRPRIYFAEGNHARGVMEGIQYYDFFGSIQIPNDSLATADA